MFYVTGNGHDAPRSFGFAPLRHGSMDGPGAIVFDDNENYKDPIYSRTMEVSRSQYDRLNEFGSNPEKFGFDKYYKDARHNCVDFTWAGLNHAGIERRNHLDLSLSGEPWGDSVRLPLPGHDMGKSAYRPAENVDDVKSIEDPVSGSQLNSQHSRPMPAHRSMFQHLLSEQRLDDPTHPDHAMYRQARDGVSHIDAEHHRAPTRHSDNLAASLVVSARASGLQRIDQVLVGRDGGRIFAVEGDAHGLDRRIAHVETLPALNTPVAESSTLWFQALQQGEQLRQPPVADHPLQGINQPQPATRVG